MPKPSPEMIKKWVDESRWTSKGATGPYDAELARSETGKTGLVNLGNTCYVNCILQALYMCDK